MVVNVESEPEERLYLTGRPTLAEFLQYVRTHATSPPGKGTLTDQWHAARDMVRELTVAEAGLADDPPMTPLGPEYEPLLIELLKDPLVRHGFNTVPTDVTLVELDRLVVYQKHIDVGFARRLEQTLGGGGATPDREQIFRTCLAYDHPLPPVKWARAHDDTFVFVSPSNDLRFLGAMGLERGDITNHAPSGAVVGVAGIVVGFSANFLNACYAEKRLVLNNGTHRAYALRRLGVTHVPCIVQHVPSRDALEVVGPAPLRRNPDIYLCDPRPPLLKDYFDARVHTVMPVRRRLRQVTVRFEVKETSVPAL
jgi:hypothetical protein